LYRSGKVDKGDKIKLSSVDCLYSTTYFLRAFVPSSVHKHKAFQAVFIWPKRLDVLANMGSSVLPGSTKKWFCHSSINLAACWIKICSSVTALWILSHSMVVRWYRGILTDLSRPLSKIISGPNSSVSMITWTFISMERPQDSRSWDPYSLSSLAMGEFSNPCSMPKWWVITGSLSDSGIVLMGCQAEAGAVVFGWISPVACTFEVDAFACELLAEVEKLRAEIREVGVLLKISIMLHGVREVFKWNWVDLLIALMWAFWWEHEVNSWAAVFRWSIVFFFIREREWDCDAIGVFLQASCFFNKSAFPKV